ncbi:MAG: hypothetical protein GX033_02465 [Firmicutes bacterium]|nr:hypothetical protein [Bacillota bacterium]
MRKVWVLIIFVLLVVTAVNLLTPIRMEEACIYYLHGDWSSQGATLPPTPSSISCLGQGQRLSLEYIATHKQYPIHLPFAPLQNHTKISLLLEHLTDSPTGPPVVVSAVIVDATDHRYQPIQTAEVEQLDATAWRYTLFFSALHPQTTNVSIYVEIEDTLFELTGVTVP